MTYSPEVLRRVGELRRVGTIDGEHQRTLAQGLVGLAEGVSRHLVERGMEFDPDEVGQQVADLAWAGLRAVHRNP